MGEWGGAPESCVPYLRCYCKHREHILNAKSSRDAFVAQRHEGHCVMHGRATQGSFVAQEGTGNTQSASSLDGSRADVGKRVI